MGIQLPAHEHSTCRLRVWGTGPRQFGAGFRVKPLVGRITTSARDLPMNGVGWPFTHTRHTPERIGGPPVCQPERCRRRRRHGQPLEFSMTGTRPSVSHDMRTHYATQNGIGSADRFPGCLLRLTDPDGGRPGLPCPWVFRHLRRAGSTRRALGVQGKAERRTGERDGPKGVRCVPIHFWICPPQTVSGRWASRIRPCVERGV